MPLLKVFLSFTVLFASLAVTADENTVQEVPLGHVTFLSGNDEKEDQSFWKEIGHTIDRQQPNKKTDLLVWLGNAVSEIENSKELSKEELIAALESKFESLSANPFYDEFIKEHVATSKNGYSIIGSWDDNDMGNSGSTNRLNAEEHFPRRKLLKLYKQFLQHERQSASKKNETLYSFTTIPFPKEANQKLTDAYENLFCVVNLDVMSERAPFPNFHHALLKMFFSPGDKKDGMDYKRFKSLDRRKIDPNTNETIPDEISIRQMLSGYRGDDDIMQFPNYHFESDNILGDQQWAWLEKTLKEKVSHQNPAANSKKKCAVTLLSSAWQILLNDNKPFVGWDVYPFSRSRLLFLLSKYEIENVLFLSGHSLVAESGLLRSTNGNKKLLYANRYTELVNEKKDTTRKNELGGALELASYTERSMQLLPPSKKSFKEENSEHDRYAKNRDGYNRGKDINKKDYGFLVELTASGLSAVFGERLSLLSLWMPPAVDVEGVRRINRKYNITQRMGDDAEEEYTQTFLQGVQRKIRDILHDYFAFLNLIRVLDFLVPRFVRNYVMDFLFFSPSVNEAESVTSTLFPRYFTNERFYKLERNYGTVQAVFLNNDDNNVEGNVEIRLTLHKITGNVEEEVTKKKRRRDPTVLQQLSFLLHELPSYKRSPLAKASFLVPESYFSSYYTAPTFPHPYREINPHQHLERSAYRFYYYNTPTQLPSLKQFLLSRQCPEWTYCMNSIHYPKYIRKKGNVLTRAGEAILFHHNQNVYPSLYNSVTILSSVVGALLIASGVGVCFIVAMYVLYFLQRTFGKPQPITVVRLKID